MASDPSLPTEVTRLSELQDPAEGPEDDDSGMLLQISHDNLELEAFEYAYIGFECKKKTSSLELYIQSISFII